MNFEIDASRLPTKPSRLAWLSGRVVSLGQGTKVLWTGNALSLVLRFTQNIVLARAAGPQSYGIYVAASVYSGILARVFDCGLPNAGAYLLRAAPERAPAFLLLCAIHCLLAAPLLFGTWYLLSISAIAGQEIGSLWHSGLGLFVALTMAQLANCLLSPMLVPLGRMRAYALAVTAPPVVALSLGLILVLTTHVTAATLVIVAGLSELSGAVVSIALLLKRFRMPGLAQVTAEIRPAYGFGLRAQPGLILKVLSQRIDRLILIHFLSPALFAAYAIGVSIRDQLSMPISIHALLVRNKLVDLIHTEKNMARARSYYHREQKTWALLAISGSTVFAILMPWVMPVIYGRDFSAAGSATAILMLSLGAVAITTNAWCVTLADNRPGVFTLVTIASALGTFTATGAGAAFYGLNGAAVGNVAITIASAFAWLALTEWQLNHMEKRQASRPA